MIELFQNHSSVCCSKVRIAMAEKGLAWESRFVDIFKGESHTPEYLRLNPLGVIPTLRHDGTVVIESTIINEYLDDTFPDVPLRPADTAARARMRLWTKQLDDSIHHAVGVVSFSIGYRHLQLVKPREEIEKVLAGIPNPAKRARNHDLIFNGLESSYFRDGLARFVRLIADMDATLADGPWLAGDTFSLADIGFAPYITRLDHLMLAPMWADRPRVADWYDRLKARPSYQEGLVAWNDQAPYAGLLTEKGTEAWPRVSAILQELK